MHIQASIQGNADDDEGSHRRPREHVPESGLGRDGFGDDDPRDHPHALLGEGGQQQERHEQPVSGNRSFFHLFKHPCCVATLCECSVCTLPVHSQCHVGALPVNRQCTHKCNVGEPAVPFKSNFFEPAVHSKLNVGEPTVHFKCNVIEPAVHFKCNAI